MFNFPLETLRRKIIGSVSINCKPGPKTALTKEEEDLIFWYCITGVKRRFDGSGILGLVTEKSGRPYPFKELGGLLGEHDWKVAAPKFSFTYISL